MSNVPKIPTPAGTPPSTVAPPLSLPEGGSTSTVRGRCPRCGSTDMASAYLVDYSDKFRQMHLAPRALKLPKISRMLRPFRNMLRVNAQVCRNCGVVMLEVSPDDLAEAERKFGRR